MATQKQVDYMLALLARAGYSTRYMDSRYKTLGATMKERKGGVTDWLRTRNQSEIDRIVHDLKGASQ